MSSPATKTVQPIDNEAFTDEVSWEDRAGAWLHNAVEFVMNVAGHLMPLLAAVITWSLSERAFGEAGNHWGLLAIEGAFVIVGTCITLGFIYGRVHQAVSWVAIVVLMVIIGMNSATGFYTSGDGYLLENAPPYLETWRVHALAWTPIIAIFLTILFFGTNGLILEKIGAATFNLWEKSSERQTDQVERKSGAAVAELEARAHSARRRINPAARLAHANRLIAAVNSEAKSAEFKNEARTQAKQLLADVDHSKPLALPAQSPFAENITIKAERTIPNDTQGLVIHDDENDAWFVVDMADQTIKPIDDPKQIELSRRNGSHPNGVSRNGQA